MGHDLKQCLQRFAHFGPIPAHTHTTARGSATEHLRDALAQERLCSRSRTLRY